MVRRDVKDIGADISWRRIPTWSDIDWHQYSLVSFDIFDTLLHRTVATPKSLFLEMGAQAALAGLVDASLMPAEFASLRVEMEREARRQSAGKSTEVTLEQIWQQAPAGMPVADLVALELEYAHSFVNPYTRDLLRYLQVEDIRVCLTSDTYFPRAFVERLLAKAAIDSTALSILLSCEQDANKANGALFATLLKREALAPERILHLGDDLTADYIQAKRAGLSVCYLADIHLPTALNQSELLLGADTLQDPLRSLRRLGHFVDPQQPEKTAFFRYLGDSVLGPGLCAFALWAARDAKDRGIQLICPIMREGALLGPLLQKACALIDATIKVKPLYTSRGAAFLPAMTHLDEQAISQYASRRHFTLNNLLEELNLPDVPPSLRDELDHTLNAISEQEQLKNFFLSEAVQEAARQASEEARTLLGEYVETLWQGVEKVALMDLGPGGTALAWLAESVGRLAERIDVNYLFYAIPELARRRCRGHRYAVFMPYSPETLPLLSQLERSHEPIETLMTGRHQTTLGYKRNSEGGVSPVLADVFHDTEQNELLAAFTAGVEQAWDHFAHVYREVDGRGLIGPEARLALLKQIQRLLELPTDLEARILGDLLFDDNAGSSSFARICSERDLAWLEHWGPDAFMAQSRQVWGYQAYNIRWPQAVVTRVYPDYLASKHRALFNDWEYKLLCVTLAEQLKADGYTHATLYGAGKLGYEMLHEAQNRGIQIDYVVDSNATLHGLKLLDKPIVPLQKAAAEGCGIYLVASAAFARQIVEGIQQYYHRQRRGTPTIYAIHRSAV